MPRALFGNTRCARCAFRLNPSLKGALPTARQTAGYEPNRDLSKRDHARAASRH